MFAANRLNGIQYLAAYKGMENKVRTYNDVVEIHLPFKAITSFAEMTAFGSDYTNYLKATVPTGSYSLKELDKVYVNVAPPVAYDKLATNADYLVYSVQKGFLHDVILLHKKSGA